jgi:hypothetical protein
VNGKSELLGRSFESLPPEERAEDYRQFASEAMRKARDAQDPDRRAEYLAMASGWHTMAVDAERAIRSEIAAEFALPERIKSTSADPH